MLRNSLRGISRCADVKFVSKKKQLQRSINTWRNIQSKGNPTYRRVVIPNDTTLHPKPRDVIENMLCPYTSLGKFYDIVCCLIPIQILILNFL